MTTSGDQDHVIYPVYATIPRAGTISALADQLIAGVSMWVPGSLAFLLAAVWLVMGARKGRGRDAGAVSGRMLAGASIRAPHAAVPMVERAAQGGRP